MAGTADRVTRFAADLVESAEAEGARQSRSAKQQLDHWARAAVFVNADEIVKQRWPEDPASHSYAAARTAADTRARLIELGCSFIAETVFSQPSELELISAAHASGYTVVLHVLIVPEELAVQRVRHRVQAGGHTVPEDKIRARYRRL